MMEYFDDRYTAIGKTATAAASIVVATWSVRSGRVFQYQDLDNTKPWPLPVLDQDGCFDGIQDPIIAMRWLSDVEGGFFT